MDVTDQTRIWDYFQGEGSVNFAGAAPRLSYLRREAQRLTWNSQISILNIGVGDGFLERECAACGWNVHAIDPSQVAIDRLLNDGIAAIVGTVEQLPYQDNQFDVVFCSEVFEHLTPDQLAGGLSQIRRVLKVGGLLIGTVPFEEKMSNYRTVCPGCGLVFHRWGHHQSFTASRMRGLLGAVNLSVLYSRPRVFANLSQGSLPDRAIEVARMLAGKFIPRRMSSNLCFAARKTKA